jgi:hypothetical protein
MSKQSQVAIIRIYDEAGHRLTAINVIGASAPEAFVPKLTAMAKDIGIITNGDDGAGKVNGMGRFAARLVSLMQLGPEKPIIVGPKTKGAENCEYQFRFTEVDKSPSLHVYTVTTDDEGNRRMKAWPEKTEAAPEAEDKPEAAPTMADSAEFAKSLGTEINAAALYKKAGKVLGKSKSA